MGRDAGIGTAREQRFGEPQVGPADRRHVFERYLRRFVVRALAQAHARLRRDRLLHVLGGALEVGLQDDADVVVARAHAPIDAQRRVEHGGAFHVDAHVGIGVRPGRFTNCGEVLDRKVLVDEQPQRRELHRDIALDAARADFLEQVEVLVARVDRRGAVGDVFAQEVERREEAGGVERGDRIHRGAGVFAGDEALR